MQFEESTVALQCLLRELMDITVVYVHEQRMSRSDCMDVHTHLGLCCLHMA